MKTLFKITNEANETGSAGATRYIKEFENDLAARDWIIATLDLSQNWGYEPSTQSDSAR